MKIKDYGQALYEATALTTKPVTIKAARALIDLLARRGQLGKVNAVIASYAKHYDRINNLTPVVVASRYPLTTDQREEITKKLTKQLDGEIELTWLQDEAIIGGLRISAGDQIIDSSILGSLNQLSEHLSN